MKVYWKKKNFACGVVLTAVVVLLAILSLAWTPYDANQMNPQHRLEAPSIQHPLGTDQYGRDILSRIMVGAVNSIMVGIATVIIGMTAGVTLGLIAAYFGRWTDGPIMGLSDLLFGFPAVLTAILISAVWGPSIAAVMVAIGIFYIPVFARLSRAVALSVWAREFVDAARACGASEWSITLRHILPNLSSPLIVQATIQFAVAILAEAGLSYLGLGTQPPHASWGRMLYEAQTFMEISPWMSIFPGLAIAWTVLGFNLLGDGIRDVLDPHML